MAKSTHSPQRATIPETAPANPASAAKRSAKKPAVGSPIRAPRVKARTQTHPAPSSASLGMRAVSRIASGTLRALAKIRRGSSPRSRTPSRARRMVGRSATTARLAGTAMKSCQSLVYTTSEPPSASATPIAAHAPARIERAPKSATIAPITPTSARSQFNPIEVRQKSAWVTAPPAIAAASASRARRLTRSRGASSIPSTTASSGPSAASHRPFRIAPPLVSTTRGAPAARRDPGRAVASGARAVGGRGRTAPARRALTPAEPDVRSHRCRARHSPKAPSCAAPSGPSSRRAGWSPSSSCARRWCSSSGG